MGYTGTRPWEVVVIYRWGEHWKVYFETETAARDFADRQWAKRHEGDVKGAVVRAYQKGA